MNHFDKARVQLEKLNTMLPADADPFYVALAQRLKTSYYNAQGCWVAWVWSGEAQHESAPERGRSLQQHRVVLFAKHTALPFDVAQRRSRVLELVEQERNSASVEVP